MLTAAISIGAQAGAQAIDAALCLVAGFAAGVFALLYLRRAGAFERALCDLFATLALAAGAVLATEFILDGKPELYGIVAYILGASVLPLIARAIRRRLLRKKSQTPPK